MNRAKWFLVFLMILAFGACNCSGSDADVDSDTDTGASDTEIDTGPSCAAIVDPCADSDSDTDSDECGSPCQGLLWTDCVDGYNCVIPSPSICPPDTASDNPPLGVCLPTTSLSCVTDDDCCLPEPAYSAWCPNARWHCFPNGTCGRKCVCPD